MRQMRARYEAADAPACAEDVRAALVKLMSDQISDCLLKLGLHESCSLTSRNEQFIKTREMIEAVAGNSNN